MEDPLVPPLLHLGRVHTCLRRQGAGPGGQQHCQVLQVQGELAGAGCHRVLAGLPVHISGSPLQPQHMLLSDA